MGEITGIEEGLLEDILRGACKRGSIDTVKEIIELIAVNLNAQDKHNKVALAYACEEKHTEIVKILIKAGANVRGVLMDEVDSENIEALKTLIESGVNMNLRDQVGRTALIWAAIKGHTEMVRMLIDKGAEMDIRNVEGETALIRATRGGYTEIAQILIDKGAKVDAQDGYGKTALMYACEKNCTEIVKKLIKVGADVRIALMYEIKKGNKGAVQTLIEAGENIINVLGNEIKKGNIGEIETLMKDGAEVIERGVDEIGLIEAFREGNIDKIKELIEAGVDLDAVDKITLTRERALLCAYEYDRGKGNKELFRKLIENGADVNAVYKGKGTILHYLITGIGCFNKSREDKIEYMAMLIEGGVYKEDILEEVERIDREERMDQLDIIIEGIKKESYNLVGYMRKVMIKGVHEKELGGYFKRIDRLNELSKALELREYKSDKVNEKIRSNIKNGGLLDRINAELLMMRSNKKIINVSEKGNINSERNM